jgi:phosphoribosyl 1,2-cyclic phosphodiesterase
VRALILASGSSGNALVVEANGTRVLVDCGLSYRQLTERLRPFGLAPADLQAVLVTHEHSDHMSGLPVLLKRHRLPVLATAGTAEAITSITGHDVELCSGRELEIEGLSVLPVATSHDAREPVAFTFGHRGTLLGVVTDTGVVTELLVERMSGCHALLLEANHDLDMLRLGDYPWALKQRILSRHGHLSNVQARDALQRLAHGRLQVVVGMHVSKENNTRHLVAAELGRVLGGSSVRLAVASQGEATEVAVARPGLTGEEGGKVRSHEV